MSSCQKVYLWGCRPVLRHRYWNWHSAWILRKNLQKLRSCVDRAVGWLLLPVCNFRLTHYLVGKLNFLYEHVKPNVCSFHGFSLVTSGFLLPVDPVSPAASGSLILCFCCRVCSALNAFPTITACSANVEILPSIVTWRNFFFRNGTSGWPNFTTALQATSELPRGLFRGL